MSLLATARVVSEPAPAAGRPRNRWTASAFGLTLLWSVGWTVCGAIGSKGGALLSQMVLARLLKPEAFGVFCAAQGAITMISTMFGTAIGLAVLQRVAMRRDAAWRTIGSALATTAALGFGLSLLLMVLIVGLADQLPRGLQSPWTGILWSSLLIGSLIALVQANALQGLQEFSSLARLQLLAAAVGLPIQVFCAWGWGFSGAVLGITIATALQVALLGVAIRSAAKPLSAVGDADKPMDALPSSLLSFSVLPLLFTSVLFAAVEWWCPLLLVTDRQNFQSYAVWCVVRDWLLMAGFVPNMLSQSVLPMLTERCALGDVRGAVHVLGIQLAAGLLLCGVLAAGLWLAAPWIAGAYGSEFASAALPFRVGSLTILCIAVSKSFETFLVARGRLWWNFALNVWFAAWYLGATWQCASWGPVGIAAGRLTAFGLHAVLAGGLTAIEFRRLRAQAGVTSLSS